MNEALMVYLEAFKRMVESRAFLEGKLQGLNESLNTLKRAESILFETLQSNKEEGKEEIKDTQKGDEDYEGSGG